MSLNLSESIAKIGDPYHIRDMNKCIQAQVDLLLKQVQLMEIQNALYERQVIALETIAKKVK